MFFTKSNTIPKDDSSVFVSSWLLVSGASMFSEYNKLVSWKTFPDGLVGFDLQFQFQDGLACLESVV